MAECYVVQTTEHQGNRLVASRDIAFGEYITHEEIPFVWQSTSNCCHSNCDQCGIVLIEKVLSDVDSFVKTSCHEKDAIDVIDSLKTIFSSNGRNVVAECHNCCSNCEVMYCSEKCRDLSLISGHKWLCDSNPNVSSINEHLASLDLKGHYRLANKVYARIAVQCALNVAANSDLKVEEEAVRLAEEMLSPYHREDFTCTMHAYRTGNMEPIDPDMFKNVIFPAYFSSQLAAPLSLCKELFQQSGVMLWDTTDPVRAQQLSSDFIASSIFSEENYSRIIGTFVVNCLSVHVASPLDAALNKAEHLQAEGDSSQDLLVNLLHLYREHKLQDSTTIDTPESGAPPTSFPGMSGSGLFPVFSKGNHSCLCNTSAHGSNQVSVSMIATEDIAKGSEITNCYIHHNRLNGGVHSAGEGVEGSADSSARRLIYNRAMAAGGNDQHLLNGQMTKKQRYRALRQYVFECTCSLCESQVVDSDEESD